MGGLGDIVEELKPIIMRVTAQLVLAMLNILYKLAANDGMSMSILVAYRFMFGAVCIIPLALYFDRKSKKKITRVVVCQAFLCALFGGSVAQNLYLKSLVLTSPTFASAALNLVPAVTLSMTVLFRMERLELGKIAGKAKVVGTIVGIGGAMVLTFYQGVEIHLWKTNINLLHQHRNHGGHVASSRRQSLDHIFGCALAITCCFSNAIALICQTKLSQRFPTYSSAALFTIMGAIQSTIFALCVDRDWTQWKLGLNIRLLTVVYAGILGTALVSTLNMACIRMRGPLFVSSFSPLLLVFVAVAASLFINEQLHLGSVIGSAIIIIGLYTVLWGKSKEVKRISLSKSCSQESQGRRRHEIPTNISCDETNENNNNNSNNSNNNNNDFDFGSGNIVVIVEEAPNLLPVMETDNKVSDCKQEED